MPVGKVPAIRMVMLSGTGHRLPGAVTQHHGVLGIGSLADRRRSISRKMPQENFVAARPSAPDNRTIRRLFNVMLDLAT